jgi:hypothetical protein
MSLAPARRFLTRAIGGRRTQSGQHLAAAGRSRLDDAARTTVSFSPSSSRAASTSTGSSRHPSASSTAPRAFPPSPGSSAPTSSHPASTPEGSPSNARRAIWPEASTSQSTASGEELAITARRAPRPTGRELEVQDQVLFALSEQVGGRFGNAVKCVAPCAPPQLPLHPRVLADTLRYQDRGSGTSRRASDEQGARQGHAGKAHPSAHDGRRPERRSGRDPRPSTRAAGASDIALLIPCRLKRCP